MGYSLRIGEAELAYDVSDPECPFMDIDVAHVELPNAPAFDEPTDYTNSRWPSYTSWSDAMRFVGLYDLMFGKGDYTDMPLLREHPGTQPITSAHKKVIDIAYEAYRTKYPKAVAGYSPIEMDAHKNGQYGLVDEEWPKENNWLTRLEWLKFWVDWALEKCEKPVFYNS